MRVAEIDHLQKRRSPAVSGTTTSWFLDAYKTNHGRSRTARAVGVVTLAELVPVVGGSSFQPSSQSQVEVPDLLCVSLLPVYLRSGQLA